MRRDGWTGHRPLTGTSGRGGAGRTAHAEVLGVPLALTDYEGTLDWIDATVAARPRAATSASPPRTR